MSEGSTIIAESIIKLYDKLIATHPTAKRMGNKMLYTSLNGNMYSFISRQGLLGLRLPENERKKFIAHYNSRIMEQYGKTMKEYVVVPASLLTNTNELSHYFRLSYDYASGLRPRATRKGKN